MRRPNSVRYRRRQAKIRGGSLILLILTVLTAVLFAVGFRTLRPALAAYAENLIQYRVTIAMEQAVADAVEEVCVLRIGALKPGSFVHDRRLLSAQDGSIIVELSEKEKFFREKRQVMPGTVYNKAKGGWSR